MILNHAHSDLLTLRPELYPKTTKGNNRKSTKRGKDETAPSSQIHNKEHLKTQFKS